MYSFIGRSETLGGIWADLSGNTFPAKLLTLQSPGGLLRRGGGPWTPIEWFLSMKTQSSSRTIQILDKMFEFKMMQDSSSSSPRTTLIISQHYSIKKKKFSRHVSRMFSPSRCLDHDFTIFRLLNCLPFQSEHRWGKANGLIFVWPN